MVQTMNKALSRMNSHSSWRVGAGPVTSARRRPGNSRRVTMKYAIVHTERVEAEPGLSARCPVCDQPMISKCGEHKLWHWAHKGLRVCDIWWEPETPWHRTWKNQFPKGWQEAVRWSESGEKHVADVMTEGAFVLEFQHSHLRSEERKSREAFYKDMMWIVDGLRRLRDSPNFSAALRTATVINLNPLTVSIPTNKGALLRDWSGSNVPVFFDFGDAFEPDHPLPFDAPVLWRLNPASPEGTAQLSPVPKARFIESILKGVSFGGVDCSGLAKTLTALSHQRAPFGIEGRFARTQYARRRGRF